MNADLPARIGRYDILRVIGRGGMGVLYHARDVDRQREVALKVMSPALLDDPEARTRFQHEAAFGRIQHRNIVRVLESGDDGDVPFIALEFLHGSTLAQRLVDGTSLPLRARIDIVIQVCEGLQCLHEHDIVHRDIKPSNIWVLEDGGVKLIDLGIAKQGDAPRTREGGVVGSAEYMAPEQLAGQTVDRRADIFSAGVVLYELVTGQKPFRGQTMAATINKVLCEATPDPRAFVPALSDEVRQALMMALQKDPGDRYADAEEFGTALRLARDSASGVRPVESGATLAAAPVIDSEPTIVRLLDDGWSEPTLIDPPIDAMTARAVPPVDVRMSDASGAAPVPTNLTPAPAAVPVVPGLARQPWLMAAAIVAVVAVPAFVWWQRAPAVRSYVLDVRSTPSGAEISVNGAVTGQRTPAVLTLVSRPRHLGLSLTGYAPIDAPLAETTEPRVDLTYRLKRVLQVQSQPAGGRILVGGRDTGLVTPADLTFDESPAADVEVLLAGYQPARQALTPSALTAGALTMTLVKVPEVVPPPPPLKPVPVPPPSLVSVSLSGSYAFSVTAVSGCGTAGAPAATTHVLQVTLPCVLRMRAPEYFLDMTQPVTVSAGQMDMAVPPLVSVQLRSNYYDCNLVVGGRGVGAPPADVEMAAGSYTATIQCPKTGRSFESRPFSIEPGLKNRKIDDYLR